MSDENKSSFSITDFFGIGKLAEKLNLDKLTKLQTFCFGAALVLILGAFTLIIFHASLSGFPTAWDLRILILLGIVFFLIGIFKKS